MASPSAPNELALLLERVSNLPPETLLLVLRDLPAVELARLSCVHKAFRVAWRWLREQQPGSRRYAPPTADVLRLVQPVKLLRRLGHAALVGDVAVIRFMFAAGVDEQGTPLLLARDGETGRPVDRAMLASTFGGHVEALELFIEHGADVHFDVDHPLRAASLKGHGPVVELLLRCKRAR